MKIIIAGGRELKVTNADIKYYLKKFLNIELRPVDKRVEIIGGEARGIDSCGKFLAQIYRLTYHSFPADWDKHGKKAGHLRNKEMAEFGDALILIWDGRSKGSANMKKNMEKLGKPVYEVIIVKE